MNKQKVGVKIDDYNGEKITYNTTRYEFVCKRLNLCSETLKDLLDKIDVVKRRESIRENFKQFDALYCDGMEKTHFEEVIVVGINTNNQYICNFKKNGCDFTTVSYRIFPATPENREMIAQLSCLSKAKKEMEKNLKEISGQMYNLSSKIKSIEEVR